MTSYNLTVDIWGHDTIEHEITVAEMGFTEYAWGNLPPEVKDWHLSEAWQKWADQFIKGSWEEIK